MSTLATAIKNEVSRLARKEAKAQVAPIKKANAQYRRDIAALKRALKQASRKIDLLEAEERRRREQPGPVPTANSVRFSPDWLRSHREKLGLSAADYAELAGVSTQTIYNWERGRSRPRDEQLATLAEIRGIGKREALRRLDG